jgi:hypothetical protein
MLASVSPLPHFFSLFLALFICEWFGLDACHVFFLGVRFGFRFKFWGGFLLSYCSAQFHLPFVLSALATHTLPFGLVAFGQLKP